MKMPVQITMNNEEIEMEDSLDTTEKNSLKKRKKEKTKDGKKITKKKLVQDEPDDCEPPTPKKKRKEDAAKGGLKKKSKDISCKLSNQTFDMTTPSHSGEEANSDCDHENTAKKKTKAQAVIKGPLTVPANQEAETNGHSARATPAYLGDESTSDSDKETEETLEQKEGAFSNFQISKETVKLLQARGVTYLFDIQVKTFNSIYDGKDVVGQARTGTGKTFSFAIPLVEKLHSATEERRRGRAPKVLVLAPTRELAIQVSKDFKDITKRLSVACFYGGSSYNPQVDSIRNGIDILVGTPGRIKDHLQNNKLNLSQLKHVVLDEVDQMLDMGFAEQVEEILASAYKKDSDSNPQTLLFSATCPHWVYEVAKKYMRPQYEHVDLIGKKTKKTATTVEHLAISCHWSQRAAVIGDVVQVYSGSHGRTIVFCETKKEATELSMNASIKQSAQSLHGDIPQKQREMTLKGFRNGSFEVLDVESYIHRSGRTGRAGRTGVCICFYQRKEEEQLRYVENKAGITFKRVGVPSANEIIKSSSKDAVKYLDSVPTAAIEYFREAAQQLIEQRGAVEALAAALAHISGATAIEQRSLLNSDAGYTTMLMKCSQEIHSISYAWKSLKEQLGEDIDNKIQRMTFLKGKTGVCFDVPAAKVKDIQEVWQDGRRWQLSVATELPELEESKRVGGDRGPARFGGRRGGGRGAGRGDRFHNSNNRRRGGGSGQKRTFSQAFDY
ncbi:hypothetical protein MATL_G00020930 [Megalops atlanticus]|uniref:RNA helicase n=1 Tax=Megalops atlanticus TaxID=7932 RepID=A0A9D3QMH1_MEGAT|nr:hypothetical protein MATL_G00020930 [Megalops atlanticus]